MRQEKPGERKLPGEPANRLFPGQPNRKPQQVESQTPEGLLANAMEAMKEDRPTIGGYRSALQQLDTYLDLKKDVADKFGLSKD